jgi:hypothetical protein
MAKVKVTKVKEPTKQTMGPGDFTTNGLPRRDGSVEEMRGFLRGEARPDLDLINGITEPSIESDIDNSCYEEPKVR